MVKDLHRVTQDYQRARKKTSTILVIDDDEKLRYSLDVMLSTHGYQVLLAADGEEGLARAIDAQPDLILTDIHMPAANGLEVCVRLRTWYTGPIIILSVIEQEKDKITAFKLGADDYITKPFSTNELLARLQAHLRRANMAVTQEHATTFSAGALTIDLAQHRVFAGDEELRLTPVEYNILTLLAMHMNCVVTYRMFLDMIWGANNCEDTRTLRVHISNLRKKIQQVAGRSPIIETESSVGFRMIEV